ncbi:MAG: hypothetical protein ACOC95_02915 [Planctomycetota bacterium]
MDARMKRCLDDLEARIDESQEEAYRAQWVAFLEGGLTEGFFTPPSRRPAAAGVAWPDIHINDALDDIDLMVWRELKSASDVLDQGGNTALNVRSNYGVGIMASQFGCPIVQMDRAQGDLPTSLPLGSEAIPRLLDAGVPSVREGLGAKVFDTAERFLKVFEQYPKIGRWVTLYHPDLQGPVDNVELVWGSEFFYSVHDDPGLFRDVMQLMADHYAAFMGAWFAMVPPAGPYSCHWGAMMKGQVMIRNDSLMNLSPETCRDLIAPHDERLLKQFGGGGIHYCGRGDHFIEVMSGIEGLTCIQLSQPHLNDMETIFAHTVDKGLILMDLAPEAAEAAGARCRGRVQAPRGGVPCPVG